MQIRWSNAAPQDLFRTIPCPPYVPWQRHSAAFAYRKDHIVGIAVPNLHPLLHFSIYSGVVQLVARQPLELVILVRVQAPEPNFNRAGFTLHLLPLP